MRPLILVTPDFEDEPTPRYVLKRPYADAILEAGGLPLVVPYGAPVDELLPLARGLVVTGGAFDISPETYGEERSEACGPAKDERTRFEWSLLEAAEARGLPILGICGGMQLLNVIRGGTLHQDIGTEIAGALEHEQKPPVEPAHGIRVAEGSLMARFVAGVATPRVNTTHHQAVCRLGRDLVATALADDGVIEAIEDPSAPFVLGVQWHPELLGRSAPWNLGIFSAFVEAARAFR